MDYSLLQLIKLALTVFVIILVPVYWKNHGVQNFLWISDIALFITVLALWLNSKLLMSAIILTALPFEILWNIDFFYQVATKNSLLGISEYMFDEQISVFVRSLSLFHIFLPFIWLWFLSTLGYHTFAWVYAIAIVLILVPLTYFFTNPEQNINWVYLPTVYGWTWMPANLWIALLMVGVPILIVLPLHLLLKYAF